MLRTVVIGLVILAACAPAPSAGVEHLEQALTVTELAPAAGQSGGHFGASVALMRWSDGGTSLAIGSPDSIAGAGQIAVYGRVGRTGPLTGSSSVTGLGKGTGPATLGYAVASTDLNRDGIPDLIFGLPGYDPDDGGTDVGAVYLALGTVVPGTLAMFQFLESPVHTSGARFGHSVTTLQDWDGDGRPDVAIGAPGIKRTFVFLGTTGSLRVNPTPSATFNEGGAAVAGIDVDGDALTDVLTGDPQYSDVFAEQGQAALHTTRGSSNLYGASPAHAFAHAGFALVALPDVTGDGLGDVAVGVPGFDAGQGPEGEVILFKGAASTTAPLVRVISLRPTGIAGAEFGAAIASLGDFDGDGSPDLAVGSPGSSVVGAVQGAVLVLDLGPLGSTSNARLIGTLNPLPQPGSRFGAALAGGADLDGDGAPDLVVGAPEKTGALGELQAGGVYVYFGTPFDGGFRDAGTTADAGRPDAGTPDAGRLDAGTPDAGRLDAGTPDAGVEDTGETEDAGRTDGGPDKPTVLPFNSVPCGCSAGAGPLLVAALLLAARRSRRQGRST